ncbi:MAG: hypothetical protein ACYCVZ_19785 [Streptosporangiaceae bacterium]
MNSPASDVTATLRPAVANPLLWLAVGLGALVAFLSDFPAISGRVLAGTAVASGLLVAAYALKIYTSRIEVTPDEVRFSGFGRRREAVPRRSLAALQHVSGVSILPGAVQFILADGLIGMRLPDYWTGGQLTGLSGLLGVPLTYLR